MGYANEAVKALVEYCFNELALTELVAVVKPDNRPSRNVLEKLGFEYVNQVSGLPEEFDFYNGELYYTLSKKTAATSIFKDTLYPCVYGRQSL